MAKKLFLDDALEHIPGGFLIYRADNKDEEILYANSALVRMFDCESYEEFMKHVGGSFKGIVSPEDLDVIEKEIDVQIKSGVDFFDHIFYHIITKSGDIKYIEDFGHYVVDPEEGPLYYVYLVDSDQKMLTYDVDKVTGLPGSRRFRNYSHKIINIMSKSMYSPTYAYIYINLSHFKRFIIRYGIKKGDALLNDVSSILNKAFLNDMVARMSDTTFAIFTEANKIEEKIKDLNKTLRNKFGYKDVLVKAGAYVIGKEDITNLDQALDNARKACHELDYSDDVLYKIYDDEMKKSQHIYNYVVNNIDEAIKNGWIQAYYQPVIRTLSGTLCSAEALARWIDPNFGILSPASIIGALEDARQIHKLDEFMLNEICKLIRDRINKGLGVVPISFNLSRLDFMLMDVYHAIIDACKRYEIPHSALKIEITESIVMDDSEGVDEIVNRLRKEGFEIWMDDFGSGYSSLGTLKDYNFDEIKLDMSFLKDFSYKSQQIIKHIISMAKSLGIQTLAEGVETEEHLEFLKSIGCEKAQGFLFSRPLPFDDMLSLLDLRGVEMEASRYSHFYDEISRIDFTDDMPMCIVNYNRKTKLFEMLFMNDSLKKLFRFINIKDNFDVDALLNSETSLFAKKVRTPSYTPEEVGAERTFFYTYLGNYIRFQSRNIACVDDRLMYVVYINNLTTEEKRMTQTKLEETIRHIYTLYNEIYSADIVNNNIDVILNDLSSVTKDDFENKSYTEANELAALTQVYIEDRDLFREFFDRETIIDRIVAGESGYITRPIRFYDGHREVFWKMVFAILVSKPEEGKILIVTRRLTKAEEVGIMDLKGMALIEDGKIPNIDIYESALLYSDIKFFWKDKDRRFLGCSQAFLDAYGFKNRSEILGKTDEEINWNVTIDDSENDEIEVIEKGKVIRSMPRVRIIKGVPHNIACTKWPIYNLGKIVGIMGYFIDRDSLEASRNYEAGLLDTETNVLNSRGFLDGLLRYINESRKLNVPFSSINIHIRNMKEIEALQGKDVAHNVEREVANVLTDNYGVDSSISHIGFGSFSIIRSFLNENKSIEFSEQIKETLEAITSVNNTPVTLFVNTVAVNSEEAKNSPEGFNRLFIDRFNELANR